MLLDFKKHGVQALYEFRVGVEKKMKEQRWPRSDLPFPLQRVRNLEGKYLPKELQRDYSLTIGIKPD